MRPGSTSPPYLKRLPVNQLKTDQSFVRDMFEDPGAPAISLGHWRGINVLAVGVEAAIHATHLLE